MFLMRPVLAGLCKYESLKDGSLDLADVFLLNVSLKVDNINQKRLQESKK